MSILIEGMELPKCCADCDYADFREFEEDRCSLTKTIIHFHYKGRNQDCPIVEVPEHGRLIDADALEEYWKPDHNRYFDADYFIHTIESAPTIIESEGK